jgi:hypothetical protein
MNTTTTATVTHQLNTNGTHRYQVNGQDHTKSSKRVYTHASIYAHRVLSDWDVECGRQVGDLIVFLHGREDLARKGHNDGNAIVTAGQWSRVGYVAIVEA